MIILCPTIVVLKTTFSSFKEWPKSLKINLENRKLVIRSKVNDLQNCYQIIISILKKNCKRNDSSFTKSDNIRLVVSGHIHESHGISKMERKGYTRTNTVLINAAIAQDNYKPGWKPIVVDL